MDIDKINELEMIEEYFRENSIERKIRNDFEYNKICCNDEMRFVDGFFTCQVCGLVDMNNIRYVPETKVIKYSRPTYKRIEYFKDKLLAIAGLKICYVENYKNMIQELLIDEELLRIGPFVDDRDVRQLWKLLQKHRYSCLYQYIYQVIKSIYNIQLIKLDRTDILLIANHWHRIERAIQHQFKNKNSMLPYNLILYHLLKRLNYPCYRFILRPYNYRKYNDRVIEIINRLIK